MTSSQDEFIQEFGAGKNVTSFAGTHGLGRCHFQAMKQYWIHLGHRMAKRLEYLHFYRFLVVCQGSLRIWAYHIQAVKLNGKSIDQDNLWNKYSQPSQYEAACPNAPVSTFQDAILTSRHDTESIYHGPEPL